MLIMHHPIIKCIYHVSNNTLKFYLHFAGESRSPEFLVRLPIFSLLFLYYGKLSEDIIAVLNLGGLVRNAIFSSYDKSQERGINGSCPQMAMTERTNSNFYLKSCLKNR